MDILEALKREEAALLKHLDTIRRAINLVMKQRAMDGKKKPTSPIHILSIKDAAESRD